MAEKPYGFYVYHFTGQNIWGAFFPLIINFEIWHKVRFYNITSKGKNQKITNF